GEGGHRLPAPRRPAAAGPAGPGCAGDPRQRRDPPEPCARPGRGPRRRGARRLGAAPGGAGRRDQRAAAGRREAARPRPRGRRGGARVRRALPALDARGTRGTVEPRLNRALGPDADLAAVVLAASGLRRVGRDAAISELLPVDVMLPAPAQGALAVEATTAALAQQPWFAPRLDAVDDPATRAAISAERALLRTLEAGCSAPVAAFAQLEDHEGAGGEGREGAGGEERGAVLHLRALAIRTDGSRVVEGQARVALDLTQDRLSGP